MSESHHQQELYHAIFGSILDRREMTPYLLRNCDGYAAAIRKASLMMANRGFDVLDKELRSGEKERARGYVRQAMGYFLGWLFPIVEDQLRELMRQGSPQQNLYEEALASIGAIRGTIVDPDFSRIVEEDPRHLFLLSSSIKYPDLFRGYPGGTIDVAPNWQKAGCSILKMCHLIKRIEEDSLDSNDYAQLGIFFESKGNGLTDLYRFEWAAPNTIPEDENARRAFVRLSMFFHKLNESISWDEKAGCYCFDSGDGVRVEVAEVKARLKSPESMFAKLGKALEEEAHGIRDILAITFLLKNREDALTLFHALQKRGVILQENTLSASITQTLFDDPEDMEESVRRLMLNLARSGGSDERPADEDVKRNSADFFNALSVNAVRNPHASDDHRKFQCKINYSLPLHRERETGHILIPGTAPYAKRDRIRIDTQQLTLPVELRISDQRSWERSEQRGDAHHDAYKFRQLVALMNRLFAPRFSFPAEAQAQLRLDQNRLFK